MTNPDVELECFYCSYENEVEKCEEVAHEEFNEVIHCQMDSPEVGHYGNTCFVAHSGKYGKHLTSN